MRSYTTLRSKVFKIKSHRRRCRFEKVGNWLASVEDIRVVSEEQCHHDFLPLLS